MEITIDASAIMAVILNEPTKPSLLAVTTNAELLAPASLPWEVGNAMTALFKRQRLTVGDARAALDSFYRIPVRLVEISLGSAVELGWDHKTYAYDAYVLECARHYRSPLLTLDGGQRDVARALGIEALEV